MSDINQNIVVTPIDLAVTVDTNQLSFTPNGISLNFFTGGNGTPGSPTSLNANISNVHIYGGTNGYVLQTDGTGNLTWTAQTGNGGGGNGTPGGSNTQVQFNNSGSFGGNAGFTFDTVTGNLNIPNNVIATNFIGYVANANYSNFSNIAASANAVDGANVSGAVAYATTANSVAGANVSGIVANATYATTAGTAGSATTAGTVTTNAQPNITSVGTLTVLSVTGNISAGNINANIGNFTTINGNLNGNVTGNGTGIANGTSNVQISTANGAITFGVNGYANVLIARGDTTVQIPNLRSSGITVGGYSGEKGNITFNDHSVRIENGDSGYGNYQVVIGSGAGQTGNYDYSVAVGPQSSINAAYTIAIGPYAFAQYANSVALGYAASARGTEAIAIGYRAGFDNTGTNLSRTIRIGPYAGNASGNSGGIAIGAFAGDVTQGADAIAIGPNAGGNIQKQRAVAIGYQAGYYNQGNNSIAIGFLAGNSNQHNNSIILNATNSEFNTSIANAWFVKPIRDVTGNADFTKTLKYNPTTGEIGFI